MLGMSSVLATIGGLVGRRLVACTKFDSTKSESYITHVKSVVIGFASGRSASLRSQGKSDL
jgi:hypothetical protein